MLGSVRSIRESFIAPFHFTNIWPLSSMRTEVSFEILKSGVSLGAAFISAFMWLLPCVTPHVYNQHVLSFKGFLLSGAAIPIASEVLTIFLDVVSVDMFDQLIL